MSTPDTAPLPLSHPTLIWVALLTTGEGGARIKLPEDSDAIDYASQMQDAGLLICDGDNEWLLSSRGMDLLCALDRLRDFSLSRL